MIVLLSVVIVLFAAAAGGSWYLQWQQKKDSDASSAGEEKPGKSGVSAGVKKGGNSSSEGDTAPARPLLRPAPSNEADRLTQMASSLQQQLETIKTREQQIATREKQMDIIHDEVKKEQKRLDLVRKEIQAELAMVVEKLEQLEKRASEGKDERKAMDLQKRDLELRVTKYEEDEFTNLKTQVKTFEKMDPEAASVVIVQMVDSGKLDTAAKILFNMRDRQAAAIFAEVAKQDAKLPGQIFERMLTLKTPQLTAPKTP
jgi:chromosome segregation ATPase